MKILITGASGFIGSYLVEEALNAGMEVWAAVRQSSSREYLQDSRIRFFHLDLRSDEALSASLDNHVGTHGPWDYVTPLVPRNVAPLTTSAASIRRERCA